MVEFSDNLFVISGERMFRSERKSNPDADPAVLVKEYIETAKTGKTPRKEMDEEVAAMLVRANEAGMINKKTEALMLEGAMSEKVKVDALSDLVENMTNPAVAGGLAARLNAATNGDFDLKVRATAVNLDIDASGKFSEKAKGKFSGGLAAAAEQAKRGWKDKMTTEKAEAASQDKQK